ncbi:MAG TPA: ABC transporter ATP-binding protein [Victivallales bacterium]|nr:ABC transporter ATP-binding protein [Victivallales bacterium]
MISISGLNKSYVAKDIEVHALQNVDISINKGEFVAVMGTSGSGKSTLMNILGCLDNKYSGKYILDETNIADLSEEGLAHIRNKKIGFVFQSYNLLPNLSLFKNIELPMLYAKADKLSRENRVNELLNIVGLSDRGNHKPNEASGGQKQRTAIARALSNNPSVLLADEPTGNLDSKSEQEIINIFKKLNESGITVIMVTHEPSVGEQAKRIIRFKDGSVISDGKTG